YTHRVAIANSRLISAGRAGVTFKYKDYRIKGRQRYKTMTLKPHEFIRRFLIHVLPAGFHRIRHYGLLANGNRVDNIARARELLDVPAPQDDTEPDARTGDISTCTRPCPCCGGPMVIIETFERGARPRAPPSRMKVIT
ncbi:MAG TPA: transposase, partial [Hyphomicrobiaceae bacterium]|nr:transposase [Hyphomicrobiaceae bacterium]